MCILICVFCYITIQPLFQTYLVSGDSRKRRIITDDGVVESKIPVLESGITYDVTSSPSTLPLSSPTSNTSFETTVRRRTHLDDELESPTKEEIFTIDEHGRKVRKIVTKKVTRTQRRIIRRKFWDENGEEHIEEVELPEGVEHLGDDYQGIPDGTLITHSPDETDTATEEELIRDADGNIVKRILKKVTHVTKRTRIIRKTIIDEHGNKRVVEQEVPVEEEPFTVINSTSVEHAPPSGITSMEIDPEKTDQFIDEHGNVVRRVTRRQNILTTERKEIKKVIILPDGSEKVVYDEGERRATMRINPQPVDRYVVTRVLRAPTGEETVVDHKESVVPTQGSPDIIEETDDQGNKIRRTFKSVASVRSKTVVNITVKVKPDGTEQTLDQSTEIIPDEEIQVEEGIIPLLESSLEEKPELLMSEEHDKDGFVTKIFKRMKEITTRYQVDRSTVQYPSDESPIQEDTISEPVETSEDVAMEVVPVVEKEVKGEKGETIRRTIRRPIPVKTRRTVIRKVILSPSGEEEAIEERIEQPQMAEPEAKQLKIGRTTVRKIIVLPDGTRQEVEAPDMDEVDLENLRKDPTYEVIDTQEGKIFRSTKIVKKRFVRKVIILPDGTKKEIQEEQPMEEELVPESETAPPQEDKYIMVDLPSQSIKTKRIIRKIIVLPNGSTKEVEEEVPIDDDEPSTADVIIKRVGLQSSDEPKLIEKEFVTRVMRKPNGDEKLIEKTETIYPYEEIPEDEAPEKLINELKNDDGDVTRRVVTKPLLITNTVTKCSLCEVLPTGKVNVLNEKLKEDPTIEVELGKAKRTVEVEETSPDGEKMKRPKEHYVSPLRVTNIFEIEPKLKETKKKDNQDIMIVEKETVRKTQEKLHRKYVTNPDGTNPRNTMPVYDVINDLVEPTKYTIVRRTVMHSDGTKQVIEKPRYQMPPTATSTKQEQKDNDGSTIRVIERIPVLVLPKKITYRKIILAPDGTEEKVEENVEEPKIVAPKEVPVPVQDEGIIPMVIDDQQSLPDFLDSMPENPNEETITKRTVYRTAVIPKQRQTEYPTDQPEPTVTFRNDGKVIICVRSWVK